MRRSKSVERRIRASAVETIEVLPAGFPLEAARRCDKLMLVHVLCGDAHADSETPDVVHHA